MMTLEQCWNAILTLARDNNVKVTQLKLAHGYDPDADRLHPEQKIDWKARAEAAESERESLHREHAVCRGRLIIAEDECAALRAERDAANKQAEIQAESLREARAEVERLKVELHDSADVHAMQELRAEVERLQTNNSTLTRLAKEAGLKWGAVESRLAAATELLVKAWPKAPVHSEAWGEWQRMYGAFLAAQPAAPLPYGTQVGPGVAPCNQPAAPAPMPQTEAERIVNGLASFVDYDFGRVR